MLGLWLGKSESSAFWMCVPTDIKARGTEDILITATDNLNGFTDAVAGAFPEATTQICVVHQIRNACRYVVWKDKKAFAASMKHIYNAPNQEAAEAALNDFAGKWEDRHSYAIKSWRDNWGELTAFYDFPVEIRRYTKNKLSFPTDDAVMKSVYLAVGEAT